MSDTPDLEARIEAALRGEAPDVGELLPLLQALFDRYRTQQRLLDRLTHISDQFQRAERDRGDSYAENYQRKVRQIEKIVRISDQYQVMLRELNERLHTISIQDELTGLPNRRFMQERLTQEIALVTRTSGRFCIALADIDRFKAINDTHGHAVGDAALAAVADILRANLREYDVCARWGGEEFLMLFPGCNVDDAAPLVERIRQGIGEARLSEAGLEDVSITISLGYTEFQLGESLDATLRRADDGLYRAKAEGRNRAIRA
ncbi:GGDEF domain-containing protein [Azospira sp. I13]|uniref:biofilm regulation diguanylate cyclase SiaD n=1 Tax=Azospira sp. I13 TaxID=1765050 RepID=UPI000D42B1A6|nr:biofilm regulation diguanylate cyclase SiaD [Azospira sp. I13]GBG01163.1 GGDEF domain-containing protein [Azospira sp. I13]